MAGSISCASAASSLPDCFLFERSLESDDDALSVSLVGGVVIVDALELLVSVELVFADSIVLMHAAAMASAGVLAFAALLLLSVAAMPESSMPLRLMRSLPVMVAPVFRTAG